MPLRPDGVITGPEVKCKCKKVHDISTLGPKDNGKTITCEKCGETFTVKVVAMIYIMDSNGKALKNLTT